MNTFTKKQRKFATSPLQLFGASIGVAIEEPCCNAPDNVAFVLTTCFNDHRFAAAVSKDYKYGSLAAIGKARASLTIQLSEYLNRDCDCGCEEVPTFTLYDTRNTMNEKVEWICGKENAVLVISPPAGHRGEWNLKLPSGTTLKGLRESVHLLESWLLCETLSDAAL